MMQYDAKNAKIKSYKNLKTIFTIFLNLFTYGIKSAKLFDHLED